MFITQTYHQIDDQSNDSSKQTINRSTKHIDQLKQSKQINRVNQSSNQPANKLIKQMNQANQSSSQVNHGTLRKCIQYAN